MDDTTKTMRVLYCDKATDTLINTDAALAALRAPRVPVIEWKEAA